MPSGQQSSSSACWLLHVACLPCLSQCGAMLSILVLCSSVLASAGAAPHRLISAEQQSSRRKHSCDGSRNRHPLPLQIQLHMCKAVQADSFPLLPYPYRAPFSVCLVRCLLLTVGCIVKHDHRCCTGCTWLRSSRSRSGRARGGPMQHCWRHGRRSSWKLQR